MMAKQKIILSTAKFRAADLAGGFLEKIVFPVLSYCTQFTTYTLRPVVENVHVFTFVNSFVFVRYTCGRIEKPPSSVIALRVSPSFVIHTKRVGCFFLYLKLLFFFFLYNIYIAFCVEFIVYNEH